MANLQLRARRDGDDYLLNGEKTSITFADCADAFLVFARTGRPEDGARGVSALFVPADLPGIRRTRFDDVGSRIVGRGSVFFDDVRVPSRWLVGAQGQDFTQVMLGFDHSRALIALQCLGTAQASLDETWAYTREREAFGRQIVQFQGVSFPWLRAIRESRQFGNSATTPSRYATPGSRTRPKQRWSSGWDPRQHSR